MSETKPRSEQIRFISDLTGEHILDDYIEACERAGLPLYELLDKVFDSAGELQADFIQFRIEEVTTNNFQFQYRFGPHVDPDEGWTPISEDIFGVAAGSVTATAINAAAALASANASEAAKLAAQLAAIQSAAYATNSLAYSESTALHWRFDTTITMADPGAGFMRVNNANPALVTQIALSNVTGNIGSPDLSAFIDTWDDSTSVIRGTIVLRDTTNTTNFAIYAISSATTTNTGWRRLNVTYVTHSGALPAASNTIAVGYTRAGDASTSFAQIITSNSADAFAVGPGGLTNSVFKVDASTVSTVNGVVVKGGDSGTSASITATSPDANAGVDIIAKGFSYARLVASGGFAQVLSSNSTFTVSGGGFEFSNSFRSFTANTYFSITGVATSSVTASTEMKQLDLNFNQTHTHQTGSYALQRDAVFTPSTHAAAAGSTITDLVGFEFNGAPIAGANVTAPRSTAVRINSRNVGAGVVNSYGLEINAQSGATFNHAARAIGGKFSFAAPTTAYASINLPHGSDPSTLLDGDIWTKSDGVYVRINGVTKKLSDNLDVFCGEIDTAVNRDYTICLVAPYPLSIAKFSTQCASGTCTAVLKNTTGTCATNSVSTTLVNNTTITNNFVDVNHKIFITISANAAAKAVAFTITFVRT